MAELIQDHDRLEDELEEIRQLLHEAVGGDPARLSDASVLPLSRQLDALILEVQRKKLRHNS
jgi:hypothetical protein